MKFCWRIKKLTCMTFLWSSTLLPPYTLSSDFTHQHPPITLFSLLHFSYHYIYRMFLNWIQWLWQCDLASWSVHFTCSLAPLLFKEISNSIFLSAIKVGHQKNFKIGGLLVFVFDLKCFFCSVIAQLFSLCQTLPLIIVRSIVNIFPALLVTHKLRQTKCYKKCDAIFQMVVLKKHSKLSLSQIVSSI